jgi:hypothetical protein
MKLKGSTITTYFQKRVNSTASYSESVHFGQGLIARQGKKVYLWKPLPVFLRSLCGMTISIAPSIETQNSFFEREIKLFPLKRLLINLIERVLAGYVKKLNNLLDEAYTDIQGALVVLKDYTQEDARRDLPSVKKATKLLAIFKARLEKAGYLGSKEVENKINMVISSLYDCEIQMKKKAFAGQLRTATPPEILEGLASASREAIPGALSH